MKPREVASVFIACFLFLLLLGSDLESNDEELKECRTQEEISREEDESLRYLP